MRYLLIALTAASTLAATAADAHPRMISATPGPNTVVGSPNEIRIGFSEAIFPRLSGVTISGPKGAPIRAGAPSAPGNRRLLIVPVSGHLAPGRYTVNWRAVSVDTHKVRGQFVFTVR